MQTDDEPPPVAPRTTSTQPSQPPPPLPPTATGLDFDVDRTGEPFPNDDEISAQMTASYSEISFKSGVTDVDIPLVDCGDMVTAPVAVATPKPRPQTLNYDPQTLNYDPQTMTSEQRHHQRGGSVDGGAQMTHYVADDVEYKIKLSSPQSRSRGDTPGGGGGSTAGGGLHRQLMTPSVPTAAAAGERQFAGPPSMGQVDARLLSDLECEAQCLATSIDNLTENLCGILHSISSITADNVDVYKNAVSKMSNSMDANIKSMYTMMAKAEEVSQAMKSVQVYQIRIKEIKRIVDLFESYM